MISIGSTGQLDFATGKLMVPSYADMELYLHEVSSAWLLEQYETGFFRTLNADQNYLNDSGNNGGGPPEGVITEGLLTDGEVDGWAIHWIGETPETVDGQRYQLIEDKWKPEETATVVASVNP